MCAGVCLHMCGLVDVEKSPWLKQLPIVSALLLEKAKIRRKIHFFHFKMKLVGKKGKLRHRFITLRS